MAGTIAFLGAALVLYAVLGGADFGAGIWEAFKGRRAKEQEALISRAMGPVWEANHVWLILVVVIMFTAFPRAFQQVVTTFHIPLSLLLVGITLRGCAFTFRHYDVAPGLRTTRLYSAVFEAASLISPATQGLIVGGLLLGRIPAAPASFADGYIWPWLTPFGAALAVFLILLDAYLAAVFLTGEAPDADLAGLFARRARLASGAVVVAGGGVFLAGEWTGLNLVHRFAAEPVSVGCLILATLLFVPLRTRIRAAYQLPARLLASAQVGLIIAGWMAFQLPEVIHFDGAYGAPLTIYNTAAPEATIRQLLIALVVGSLLIFPALGYLLFVFKVKPAPD
jgi:cytochrome d ubiquinol oxidase subunit II